MYHWKKFYNPFGVLFWVCFSSFIFITVAVIFRKSDNPVSIGHEFQILLGESVKIKSTYQIFSGFLKQGSLARLFKE